MQVVDELARYAPGRETVATIGVFDGVHQGHRHLMERVLQRAREQGALSAVLTFHPIPRTVLAPGTVVPTLTTLEERLARIRALGIDLVVPLTFTLELSRLTAREFMTLVKQHLRLRGLVIGPDFALGRGREGNADALRALGAELGFWVETVSFVTAHGERVSSTAIRQAIEQGDVARARALLGHPFSIRGTVIPGRGRGRALGFPTANIEPLPGLALPADGIYATMATVHDGRHSAATYIGTRPTFEGGERLIEAFLLDFAENLYGRPITIDLIERVRGDQRFASTEALTAQMERDIAEARRILAGHQA
ncbi:MAG: bifunctional riboflavin kinase/FAD synthetase [Chloroflexi bacterium]|nr:bifunctional riboflavin kinase/FAD synthetase [Chloroflexota bacterium]